jgi:ribonuclease Z
MLSVTFLGTSAARPTAERGVSAFALTREGETLMFECGEGTQRQMMRFGVSFSVSEIFFSHFHADHFLGITGLVRTWGLQGREDVLHLYGPRGARRLLGAALELGRERSTFPIEIHEIRAGDILQRKEYDLEMFPVEHGSGAVGFAVREHERLGRFDPQKAQALGVPEGPLWGKIHRGETVEIETRRDDGSLDRRTVGPEEIVGEPRPGRVVVYSGDTRPCKTVVDMAAHADLLIHEATFSQEEAARAVETAHATAREAAQVALAAQARRLVLTHLSARFSVASDILLKEAQEIFTEVVVARDGMMIEVPFLDSEE